MNPLDYARLISPDQQMEEGWLLVRRSDGTDAIERYDEDPENIFADDDEARYFVAECTARTVYLICNTEIPLGFWQHGRGWGPIDNAVVYSINDQRTTALPVGGRWCAINPNFGVRYV